MEKVSLRRRVWFWWTVTKLAMEVVLVLLIGAGCAALGVMGMMNGEFKSGFLTLAFGMAVIVLRRQIKVGMYRELKKRHCCPHCEYELRGSGGFGSKCPECGWRVDIQTIEI